MLKTLALVIISELWTSAGHLLLKKSTNAVEYHSLRTTASKLRFLRNVIAKPTLWLGLGGIALGLVIWLLALSGGDLSVVYPMSSVAYIIVLFAAHFFLGERIDRMKLLGTFLVILSILFLTMS